MKKVNINKIVKVKLTPKGADIYYHQNDDLRKHYEEIGIDAELFAPRMPKVDKDGFTEFQLWKLFQLYGKHMFNGCEAVFSDISIYFDDGIMEDVKMEKNDKIKD